MANYGDSDNVINLLSALGESPQEGQISYAMTAADRWINSETSGLTIPSNTPEFIIQAAEYYATSILLLGIYNTETQENPTVNNLRKDAKDFVNKWKMTQEGAESQDSPYRISKTPNTKDYTTYDIVGGEEW